MLSTIVLLFAATVLARELINGRGKLPVMGYDTYNAFERDYDGAIATAQAKVMNETGLVALGYNTFILDDFYTELERNSSGYLVANETKFPGGMRAWTDSINQYGMTGSIYSSNGYKTCGGYPAAYGHEMQDLEVWREWGWTTMLKYDNCVCTDNKMFRPLQLHADSSLVPPLRQLDHGKPVWSFQAYGRCY